MGPRYGRNGIVSVEEVVTITYTEVDMRCTGIVVDLDSSSYAYACC
jgi:hypothetical protein